MNFILFSNLETDDLLSPSAIHRSDIQNHGGHLSSSGMTGAIKKSIVILNSSTNDTNSNAGTINNS